MSRYITIIPELDDTFGLIDNIQRLEDVIRKWLRFGFVFSKGA